MMINLQLKLKPTELTLLCTHRREVVMSRFCKSSLQSGIAESD
jgi:hypothetical protein